MAASQGKRNGFVVGVSAAVVVLLIALGVGVWALNSAATAPGETPKAESIDAETGAITFGDGGKEVVTYVDFMCPACGQFEAQFGEGLQSAALANEITLKIHPVSILDRASQGTKYSSRSAGSMYCVAAEAPDAALEYFNALYASQPQEASPGLDNAQLVALAEQVGAGAAATCIEDETYAKYSLDKVKDMPADPATGNVSTPTVVVDGTRIDSTQVGVEMQKLLTELAAG